MLAKLLVEIICRVGYLLPSQAAGIALIGRDGRAQATAYASGLARCLVQSELSYTWMQRLDKHAGSCEMAFTGGLRERFDLYR